MDVVRTVPLVAALVSAVTLPDGASGSTNGKGFTGTGLARTPAGRWVAGNHGKAQDSDPTYQPSIVFLSEDFSVIEDEIALPPGTETVQGVVYDESDDSIWYSDSANNAIRHIDLDGNNLGDDILLSYAPNGIARVSADDTLFINSMASTTVERRSCVDGGLISSQSVAVSDRDQLFYIQDSGKLLYSWGVNGVAGHVNVYTLQGGVLTLEQSLTLTPANAIEGIVLNGTTLTVLNDAYFHLGGSATNTAQTYTTNLQ